MSDLKDWSVRLIDIIAKYLNFLLKSLMCLFAETTGLGSPNIVALNSAGKSVEQHCSEFHFMEKVQGSARSAVYNFVASNSIFF